MFERFTDRARRVLVVAQQEARLLGHDYIGTEHILLGLLGDDQSVAAKALGALGISLKAARTKVNEIIAPSEAPLDGSPPAFTPRAKKTLELSLREALQLGHNYIGTEHILLGLVREGEGVGAQILQSMGATLEGVREEVITLLGDGTAADAGTRQYGDSPLPLRPIGLFPSPGAGDPPFCPRCGHGLENNLSAVPVVANEDVADRDPVAVAIVYCTMCGFAIGTTLLSNM